MIATLPPFDRRVLEFNQFPSQTLHPSRRAAFGSSANLLALETRPKARAALHRLWSKQILGQLGAAAEPVLNMRMRESILALLPSEALEAVALRAGAVLCGRRLRSAIAGPQVRVLERELGMELLAFARQAETLHPGLPEDGEWNPESARKTVESVGCRALLAALSPAGESVVRRVELKLPQIEGTTAPVSPGEALALSLSIVEKTDPVWLSSFPTPR